MTKIAGSNAAGSLVGNFATSYAQQQFSTVNLTSARTYASAANALSMALPGSNLSTAITIARAAIQLAQSVIASYKCQSARKRDPGSAFKKDPRRASFCSVQRRHPSAPAHAFAEPARGAAVKNGRFISGRPQGLFLRAVSTAA